MKVGKDLLDVSILKNYLCKGILSDVKDSISWQIQIDFLNRIYIYDNNRALYIIYHYYYTCNTVIAKLICSQDINKIKLGLNLLKNSEN